MQGQIKRQDCIAKMSSSNGYQNAGYHTSSDDSQYFILSLKEDKVLMAIFS